MENLRFDQSWDSDSTAECLDVDLQKPPKGTVNLGLSPFLGGANFGWDRCATAMTLSFSVCSIKGETYDITCMEGDTVRTLREKVEQHIQASIECAENSKL